MANNNQFRNSFEKRIDKSKGKFDLFFKKFVVEVDTRLVSKSPVDTGRFKANWMVGNGVVNSATTQSLSPANNSQEINSIKVNGQIIYLSNSLPYAGELERGSSKQAPQGIARLTIIEMQPVANKIGAELRLL